jgi:hypothetical protein
MRRSLSLAQRRNIAVKATPRNERQQPVESAVPGGVLSNMLERCMNGVANDQRAARNVYPRCGGELIFPKN